MLYSEIIAVCPGSTHNTYKQDQKQRDEKFLFEGQRQVDLCRNYKRTVSYCLMRGTPTA